MPKSLNTATSVWMAVFRRITDQLEADTALTAIIPANKIRSWKGDPIDETAFVPTQTEPALRLTPQPRNVTWYSEDSQSGELYVHVEAAIMSFCVDDVADFYDLIVSALRPGGDEITSGVDFAQDLVETGAETGEIVFSDPTFEPNPDKMPKGNFLAVGGFQLRVTRTIMS